jgi:DNA-binding IclR family transcriptional regulator
VAKQAKSASGTPEAPPDMHAETRWFHLFRAMIDSGDLARMDGSTVKVYIVIKAHTNLQTGTAFPGVETIAEKSGLSRVQVWRALQALDEMGYVTKTKQGRHNIYQLREKVQITDGAGHAVAQATWDYLPTLVKEAVADLRQVLASGDFGSAKIVHIDHLYVQINANAIQPGGVANNLSGSMANALQSVKDPVLREQIARASGMSVAEEAVPNDTLHE